MTSSEPEQLALRLQELLERRSILRGFFEQAIRSELTDSERFDLEHVIRLIDAEMAGLEQRLRSLQPGAGGTG